MNQSPRDGFGKALAELGSRNERIIVLTNLPKHTRSALFAEKHPQRFIHCNGEQTMLGIATGLALNGKIPIIASTKLGPTAGICARNMNVKIASTQGMEDAAMLKALPNITIIEPADANEAYKAGIASAVIKGPVYIRLSKEQTPPLKQTHFVVGRAEILRNGEDCTIVACGRMVHEALKAAHQLAEQGIQCTVINNHTIKPLDKHTILSSAKLTGCIVVADQAGLGGIIAETLLQNNPVPLRTVNQGTQINKQIIAAVKETIAHKCEAKINQKAEIHAEHHFYLHNGNTIGTLRELLGALLNMDDATYAHHVNSRNDFATWVQDGFKDKPLAKKLAHSKTKLSMASVLANNI